MSKKDNPELVDHVIKPENHSKKPYQKPLIRTEKVEFEDHGVCLKQPPGYGSPCANPRKS